MQSQFQFSDEWITDMAKSAQNKESACEELTQCAYSKIQSVVIDCEDFKCD
jgi:hypothetical protein